MSSNLKSNWGTTRSCCNRKKLPNSFCKIGGLDENLKTLREIIIFPLMHPDVYNHFDMKAPRGVLFYGPPGTGKTLVASTLATEINKEGTVHVNFIYKKCSDILDSWFGESEKKLTEIFEKANQSKPSIIFFDEIDGLAPCRGKQTEQVYSSIVSTLLSLMDGVEDNSGLIVIGATNRIEALDPALRRPGRFDKELYFPLPGAEARKAILEVHMKSWKNQPSENLLSMLVEATSGFSGADLRALCSETILNCIKRIYPKCDNIQRIDLRKLELKDCDFINAKMHHVSTAIKCGKKMRKLSPVIRPLLEAQLKKILNAIYTFRPHFFIENFRYKIGEERYAGRVLLIGNNLQGLNIHLIPSILQRFDYLPLIIYDINTMSKLTTNNDIKYPLPKIILLSKIDEWWDCIDERKQRCVVSSLEEIYSGLPILVIGTCKDELPTMLQNFFYNNNNLRIKIENPTKNEIETFLRPLFYNRNIVSLFSVLERSKNSNGRTKRKKQIIAFEHEHDHITENEPLVKKHKRDSNHDTKNQSKIDCIRSSTNYNFPLSFSYLLHENNNAICDSSLTNFKESLLNKQNKSYDYGNIDMDDKQLIAEHRNDAEMEEIRDLWRYATIVAVNMNISQLESLYDVIAGCINIYWNNYDSLLMKLRKLLENVEKTQTNAK